MDDRLVIVSNRLPLPQGDAGKLPAGGVVSALLPTLRARGGMWIGWSGRVQDTPEVRELRADGIDLVAVDFTPEAFEGYYRGFSNATLWPRMHGLESRARFKESDYTHYREVNRALAAAVHAQIAPGETVWVHDYQLIPQAAELRALGWDGPVGYFHHIPIPARGAWNRIPHADALARALRSYSHIGVQTERDARHLRAILGRGAPAIEVHPVPIDSAHVRAMAVATPCVLPEPEIAGRVVVFGVDRLDYTKGIPQRLEAWELALERDPSLRDRAVFVQWAAPSREGIEEYREERAAVEAIAARITARFPDGPAPILLSVEEHSYEETAAALCRADVAVVTSVADGMNLVAKEFAAVHDAEHPGVLVLSDGCGAVAELGEAIVVDRRSAAATADGIERAVAMRRAERAVRAAALRRIVDDRSSSAWARTTIDRIALAHEHVIHARTGVHARRSTRADRRGTRPAAPSIAMLRLSSRLQPRADLWTARMERTCSVERLWRRDPSLWPGAPEAIAGRLGWLDVEDWLGEHLPGLRRFALDVVEEGYTTAVVLGMGGSSATARVFAAFGDAMPRGLRLLVLDSTSPAAVRDIERQVDPGRTLFIAISKSGTTLETRAFLDYFWSRHPVGRDFVAVTDARTPLATTAVQHGFRWLFVNPADIGGRFSALSYPGLLAAALAGVDLDLIATHARAMMRACRRTDLQRNPGARLGAVLAQLAHEDRRALFLEVDPRLAGFDDWIAQLVAESTGKEGRGLLPMRMNPRTAWYASGDTVFVIGDDEARAAEIERMGGIAVRCPVVDREAIAAEFVRWQVGVALACSLMEVNAFDEPDVAAAKRATAQVLASEPSTAPVGVESLSRALAEVARRRDPRDFVAIHAYVPRTPWMERRLATLRRQLSDRYGLPVALEFGPALLHATGQFYKGGPAGGLVVQVLEAPGELPIPGREYDFGALIEAQALGDALAMIEAGRAVARGTIAELAVAAELVGAPRVALDRDRRRALT